jgi:hypothetical protein
MNKSIFEQWQDRIVWMAAKQEPTEEEWTAYCDLLPQVAAKNKAKSKPLNVLVVTDGGGPNFKQRTQFMKATKGIRFISPVVTSSLVARAIITVFTWSDNNNKAFAPSEIRAAFDFMDVDQKDRADMWQSVIKLQARFGAPVASVAQATPFV